MTMCLVSGGGGFLGSHLSAALLRAGHAVRVLDRNPPSAQRLVSDWVVGDFTSPDHLEASVAGCNVVFHLAATTLPKTSNDDPRYDVHTNVEGSVGLLDAARRHGVCKIVFVSSGGTVYGIPRRVPIAEDDATEPISSYGITKLAIEKYLHLFRHLYGLEFSVIRLANPYGELQRADRAQGTVAVFLDRVIRGLPIEIWGDGSVVRDYVYVGDAIEAMIKAAFETTQSNTYNIGSGRGTSLLELVSEIGRVTGTEPMVEFKPARPFDVPKSILDISRARAELGWEPRVSLGEGLRRTHDWLTSRL
jgi:UDP-glucose 4-epimerase